MLCVDRHVAREKHIPGQLKSFPAPNNLFEMYGSLYVRMCALWYWLLMGAPFPISSSLSEEDERRGLSPASHSSPPERARCPMRSGRRGSRCSSPSPFSISPGPPAPPPPSLPPAPYRPGPKSPLGPTTREEKRDGRKSRVDISTVATTSVVPLPSAKPAVTVHTGPPPPDCLRCERVWRQKKGLVGGRGAEDWKCGMGNGGRWRRRRRLRGKKRGLSSHRHLLLQLQCIYILRQGEGRGRRKMRGEPIFIIFVSFVLLQHAFFVFARKRVQISMQRVFLPTFSSYDVLYHSHW